MAEDVNDVDFFGDVFEARVGAFAEDFGFGGVDGINFVADGLEVVGYAVAGAVGAAGEAYDGDY